ncbi:hypothetical protein B0H14DRAFT_1537498 [Mycena olivaceomarginata]|nr:hypothetical protein B0H14DRAFT_1537498 [Mycena olivaceomarginata]
MLRHPGPRLLTFYTVSPFVTAVIIFSMTAYKCGSTLLTLGLARTPIFTVMFTVPFRPNVQVTGDGGS